MKSDVDAHGRSAFLELAEGLGLGIAERPSASSGRGRHPDAADGPVQSGQLPALRVSKFALSRRLSH